MATVKVIRVKYEADASDLERSRELIKQIAKETGLTETEVTSLNAKFKEQTGIIEKLRAAERSLLEAREKANNPALIKQLTKEIEKAQAEIRGLTNETKKAEGAFFRLKDIIIGGLAVNVIQSAVRSIGAFAKGGLDSAVAYEKATKALEGVAGSAKKAELIMARLEDFQGSGLFSGEDLTAASKVLLSFGTTTEDLIPKIKQLGNISLGTGVSVEQLSQSYVKLQAKGEGSIRELISLNQQGVPIFAQLAKDLGLSISKVGDLAEKGKISAEQVNSAFAKMTAQGGQFFNQIDKSSDSAAGQIALFKDNVEDTSRAMAQGFLPVINSLLRSFNGLFVNTHAESDALREQAEELINEKNTLNALVPALNTVQKGSVEYNSILAEINKVSPKFLDGLDIQKASWKDIQTRLVDVNDQLERNIALLEQQATVQAAKEDVADISKVLGDANVDIRKFLGNAGNAAKQFRGTFVEEILKGLDLSQPIENQIKEFNTKVDAAFAADLQTGGKLTQFTDAFQNSILSIVRDAGDRLSGLRNELGDALGTESRLNKELEANPEQMRQKYLAHYQAMLKARVNYAGKVHELTSEEKKDIADVGASLKKLRDEAELASVGGGDTQAGIELLRKRKLAELEAEKAFTLLNADEQATLRAQVNQAFDDKEFNRKKTEGERLEKQDAEFQARIDESRAANAKKRSEDESKFLADRLSNNDLEFSENATAAKNEFLAGTKSKEELNKKLLELELHHLFTEIEIRRAAGEDVAKLEQDLADKRISIKETEAAVEKEIADKTAKEEADAIEKRKENLKKIVGVFSTYVSEISNLLGAIDGLQAAQSNQQIKDLDKRRDAELLRAGKDEQKKLKIEEDFAKQKAAIEREENIRKQKAAESQAIIQGALAIAQLTVGLPATLPLMVIAAAITAVQVAAIKAEKFAGGVIDLKGPGTGTSDSIPARLSRGESVMTADETRRHRDALLSMRMGTFDKEFLSIQAAPVIAYKESAFTDSRIVENLKIQNKYSAKMIRKIDQQNELLTKISNFGGRNKQSDFR